MVPFFERRDPGEECRNCLLLPPRLQPDWMPGRLHFDGIEDPVGIFRVGAAPHFVGKVAPRVSFHIQFTAALITPAGKSLVAIISENVSVGSGFVAETSTTAQLPLKITGATSETNSSSVVHPDK